MQAVTSKGQTPASNSPDDIAKAIGKIAVKTKASFYQIASINFSSNTINEITKTVSIASYANYRSLTLRDFAVFYAPVTISQGYVFGGSVSITLKAYNASNGILTVACKNNIIGAEGGTSVASISVTVPIYIAL